MMNNEHSAINSLPSELLLKILQYIVESSNSTPYLLQCALVCKSWSYYALQLIWYKPVLLKPQNWSKFCKTLKAEKTYLSYPPLVRRINLSAIPDFISDDSLLTLSVCKQLDRLTLTGCYHITSEGMIDFLTRNVGQFLLSLDLSELRYLTNDTIYTIANTCRQLQGLNLTIDPIKEEEWSGITDDSIITLAKSCKDLKRIRLSNWKLLTDESIFALTKHCPALLEIDVVNCAITNIGLIKILERCRELRELKLNNCQNLNDIGFLESPLCQPITEQGFHYYDQLRILELTNVTDITDRSIDCITRAAPKIRNLVLNKCFNITDKGVEYITRLGRYLHYLHLGSCRNITDMAVIQLASRCTRIRYIDLAGCHKLGDESVIALAGLPKLKRIGLVKCHKMTNRAIMSLTRSPRSSISLERIHLSYCEQLTAHAISALVIHCKRLTHLSLSFIPAFQHEEFQRFCRPPPKDYSAEISSFCVFSGQNIHDLRNYFKSSDYIFQRNNRIEELNENLQRANIVN